MSVIHVINNLDLVLSVFKVTVMFQVIKNLVKFVKVCINKTKEI